PPPPPPPDSLLFGLRRFSFGLGKKVIIANTLGNTADAIFSLHSSSLDISIAWLGAICYSLQLYFDFSGYSDMAIGLGRIFGFRFPENFNYPYISRSITEFWRRWHITLGAWFREYLYIPLGGNRISTSRTYFNLFVVFLATGIWHGAEWTFIVWGILHGIVVIVERMCTIEHYTRWYHIALRHCYVLIFLSFGWVLFRADSLRYGIRYIRAMLGFPSKREIGYNIWYYLDAKIVIVLIIAILLSTGITKSLFCEVKEENRAYSFSINITSLCIAILSLFLICASTYNPFIYFRF
ncbi:MAG: MBOAT family protein, partial [Desulfovibrionaceae bacterium]|nr:MBOAT family protein [Desulfovibrionaceae bacterium]